MDKEKDTIVKESKTETPVAETEASNSVDAPQEEQKSEEPTEPTLEEQLAAMQARVEELEKQLLYKQAEFENYRRNQIKEKADLILNGGKKVLESMLPVVDDFELALSHMDQNADVNAVKEGVELILKKFTTVLKAQGVEAIDTKDQKFNTDFHEAVAQFPAPTPELKDMVIDCTKKGYMLNGKVLRFAQVVVGM